MPFTKSGGLTPIAFEPPLITALVPSLAPFKAFGVTISIAVPIAPNLPASMPFSFNVSSFAFAV